MMKCTPSETIYVPVQQQTLQQYNSFDNEDVQYIIM